MGPDCAKYNRRKVTEGNEHRASDCEVNAGS